MIFTNVIEPTHLCNLACTYCYNEDVREPIMTERTFDRVIEQTFAYVEAHAPQRLVSFIWHMWPRLIGHTSPAILSRITLTPFGNGA